MKRRFLILTGLLLALIGFSCFAFVSWHTARSHLSPAPSRVGPPPTDWPYPVEAVTFTARDGLTLEGWYSETGQAQGVVLLLHHYRGNRTLMMGRARMLMDAGYDVLLYDARAHGESEGDLISLGYYETQDVLSALDYVRARNPGPIACLGISQGGATILLAAEQLGDVRAVICESTYDTLRHAGDRRFRNSVGLPGWLAGALYGPFVQRRLQVDTRKIAPIDHIGRLPCPVFVLSGVNDRHTLESDTFQLFNAAQAPRELWMVPDAAHVDLYAASPEEYQKRILRFLNVHLSTEQGIDL